MASKVPSWMISAQLSSHTHTHTLTLSVTFVLTFSSSSSYGQTISQLSGYYSPLCLPHLPSSPRTDNLYKRFFCPHLSSQVPFRNINAAPSLSAPLSPTKNHHYINSQTISGRWFIRGFAQTWRQKGSWPDYTNLSRSSSSGATWKAVIILSECFKSWRVIIRISR